MNLKRKLVALAAGIVIALTGGGVAIAATQNEIFTAQSGRDLAFVACTVRNLGSGWSVLNNTAHSPSNCQGVISHAGPLPCVCLEIQHSVAATAVKTSSIGPDETFASQSIRVGASVGLAFTYIYIYTPTSGTLPIDPATLAAPTGNIWIEIWLKVP